MVRGYFILAAAVVTVGELLQLALFRRIFIPLSRHFFVAQLLCSPGKWYRLLVPFVLVMASSFLQGQSVPLAVAYQLGIAFFWHFFNKLFDQSPLVFLGMSMLFVGGSFVVTDAWLWTPFVVIANIIIAPVMVFIGCGV